MDKQDIRSRSSAEDTKPDAKDAPREYGVNWPFPPVGGPKPLTAKQRKLLKAKDISDVEEALL